MLTLCACSIFRLLAAFSNSGRIGSVTVGRRESLKSVFLFAVPVEQFSDRGEDVLKTSFVND